MQYWIVVLGIIALSLPVQAQPVTVDLTTEQHASLAWYAAQEHHTAQEAVAILLTRMLDQIAQRRDALAETREQALLREFSPEQRQQILEELRQRPKRAPR